MFHTFLLCPHVEIFAEFLLQFEDFQFFAGVLKWDLYFMQGHSGKKNRSWTACGYSSEATHGHKQVITIPEYYFALC